MNELHLLKHLGKISPSSLKYDPSFLEPISRKDQQCLPINTLGSDQWTLYELSYRLSNDSLQTLVGDLNIPLNSPKIIESKSLKLYLFGLSTLKFSSVSAFERTLRRDLSYCLNTPIQLSLYLPQQWAQKTQRSLKYFYQSITDLHLNRYVFENFRSQCPVTFQPDWASIFIFSDLPDQLHPQMTEILSSLMDRAEFHEMCISRIYSSIFQTLNPQKLIVLGRFTRRGGIDINPLRSNLIAQTENIPFILQ